MNCRTDCETLSRIEEKIDLLIESIGGPTISVDEAPHDEAPHGEAPHDDMRAMACKDPWAAHDYARDVDKAPHATTRAAACKDTGCAYWYARDVDKAPRNDTRAAACKDAKCALGYARDVDKAPRNDTRRAACKGALYARYYATDVDKAPRDDTWGASGECQADYLRDVPGAIEVYFRSWLVGHRYNRTEMERFCYCQLSDRQYGKIQKLELDAAVAYTLKLKMPEY